MEKVIITAAICGAEVTREDTPYLPVTQEELARESYRAAEAGAAMVHLHVRDRDGNPTQDRDIYREAIGRIRSATDVLIQVSTGGAVGMTPEERAQPLCLRPDMATLTTGSVNFGGEVFLNSPATIRFLAERCREYGVTPEIEVFEAGMIQNALALVKEGLIDQPLRLNFVLGVAGGLPATPKNLLWLAESVPAGSIWTVSAMGRHQLPMNALGIILGGHVRTGLEDNIFLRKGELSRGNAPLVARVAVLAQILGRAVAGPGEARELLKL